MSNRWKRIFVFTAYTAFILAAFSTCSCNQKAWTKRGVKKGWLDTTKVKENNFEVPPNIAAGDSAIDDFSDSIAMDIKIELGIDLSHGAKEKIKWRTNYIKVTYPDTTMAFLDGSSIKLWFDSTGTIHGTPKYKQQVIKEAPCDPWYSDWPYWLIIGILFLLLWLTRRK
jgi:hypothetical protein